MKRLISALVLACGVAASAPPAQAYVPPSQYILKKMITKRADVKSVRIRSMVSLVEGDKPSAIRFRDITLYNGATRTLRSFAVGENDSTELFAMEKRVPVLDPVPAVLFDNNLKTLSQSLKDNGIPVKTEEELLALASEDERRAAETESLARYMGDVAWVIGKADSSDAQFWAEQDTFLPLRLLFKSEDGWADIRFDKYRWIKEFPYPRIITEARKGGGGTFQAELTDLAVNPDLSELKRPLGAHGFTAAGNSAPGALKDLIRRYYEVIR